METALSITKISLSVICILAVIASKIKLGNWWIRVFDFTRIQLLSMAFIAMLLFFIPPLKLDTLNMTLLALVIFSFFYQAKKIFPYTILAKKEVKRFRGSDKENGIAMLVSNVLTPNRQAKKLIDLVKAYQPNLVLTLESDKWWEKELESLKKDFPHQVKIPQDNLYGMHLFSNLPLENTKIHYLVKDDIPSIHSEVVLPSGKKVQIHCVHPEPPSPTESDTSVPRDAELLIIGKNVKEAKLPVLVFGDLNDVAWSRTTRLFQKISGLLDPRKGRGFYNTFHANHNLLRWPLDHIFHSEHFQLKKIKRLPSISSDHFPIFIHLILNPGNGQEDQKEKLDQGEKNWTKETIADANPNILTI